MMQFHLPRPERKPEKREPTAAPAVVTL